MRSLALCAYLPSSVLLSAACLTDDSPTAPHSIGGRDFAPTAPAETPVTLDEELLELGRLIDGFGGAFLEDGAAVLLLLDPSSRPESALAIATQYFAAAQSELSLLAKRPIRIRPATHSFESLYAGRRAFDDRWPKGTISSDIDERDNRVLIAVISGEGPAAAVEATMDPLKVPRASWAIVVLPHVPHPAWTLSTG